MNFNDLYRKIASLDTPVSESTQVSECGEGPMPPTPNQQQDSVNMNVTMSGSGTGGIKDLLNILKNIEEKGEAEVDLEKEVDGMEMPMIIKSHDAVDELEQEALANSPHELYATTDEVLPSGDDLHKEKDAYLKANGGDNPMNIKARLESLYQEIKGR